MLYEIVDNHLVIEDKELGISFRDAHPFTSVLKKEYRKDGSLLQELYIVEQETSCYLHGPERYYFSNGTLASECWYIHSKKEGRAISYTSQGVVVKKERYLHGKLHGMQKFYYENGQLQGELCYEEGLLHGQSILYYQNGNKKRQLECVRGKRHGRDLFWEEDGTVRFCLLYDHGICRKNHSYDHVEERFIHHL